MVLRCIMSKPDATDRSAAQLDTGNGDLALLVPRQRDGEYDSARQKSRVQGSDHFSHAERSALSWIRSACRVYIMWPAS